MFLKSQGTIVLKQMLTANAVFSTASGLMLIVARDALAAEITAPPWLFVAIGVGLLAFAAQLALMVAKPELARRLAMQVVLSDVGWVVATSAALVAFYTRVSALGVALIVVINVVVATLALLQYRGLTTVRSRATAESGI